MARFVPDLRTNGVYVITRPSAFIRSQVDDYAGQTSAQVRIVVRLVAFYLVNLLLYAGPLTLAGFGSPLLPTPPPGEFSTVVGAFYRDTAVAWEFTMTLAQNSAYLLAISGLTLVTFHAGVWITRSSRSVIQSLHTVVFSTGIYLAAIFTLTWYLSTAEAIAVADEFLIYIQGTFVYFFIDLLGANLGLPGGRPEPTSLAGLTQQGKFALVGLALSLLYYFYSLYLGARINHQTSRFDAAIAVLFVGLSPAIYIAGSIAVYVINNQPVV